MTGGENDDARIRTTSRLVLAIAAALAVAGVVAALFASSSRGGGELGEAGRILADEDRFAAASTAGTALNRVSILLQRAGERCDADTDTDTACDDLFTAAAAARVAAVAALRCQRPQLFETRLAFAAYLDAIDDGRRPEPPAPPEC